MNERTPNLDDLVSAHREGVRLSSEQHGRNRARLLSRVAAGVAVSTAAAGASTSTAAAATASHVSSVLLVKVVIGLMVVGGAGAAYYVSRPVPAVVAVSAPVQEPEPAPLVKEENAIAEAPTAEPANDTTTTAPRAPKPSASGASSLANEIQVMHDVEASLSAGEPAHALQLLDAASKTYGGRYGGAMGEERAAARVVTLCRLGRTDEARAEAARFVRDRPRSPLIERVRSTCAKSNEPR
jgi:hypothetical protein